MKKLLPILLLMMAFTAGAQNKLYVNQSIAVSGDGTSWATAIKELRDAIPVMNSNTLIDSILVAAGVYKATADNNTQTYMTFTRGKIKLYGGYANDGSGTRNISANTVYLDGEIGNPGDATDNSNHIITIENLSTTDSIVIDGFSFRNEYGSSALKILTVNNGNKTAVRNCSFNNNLSVAGALSVNLASPLISNCSFESNSSYLASSGSGINMNASSAIVENCSFLSNIAANGTGGAIAVSANSGPTIKNCIFTGNLAATGGAIGTNFNCGIVAIGNVFNGNTSTNGGGGAIKFSGTLTNTLVNNLFIANKDITAAGAAGGAVATTAGTTSLINNTFYKDTANNGGAIARVGGTVNVYNNVFYKNYSGNGIAASNDINGTFTGSNNSFGTTNPFFVNEDNLAGFDGKWGTADDGLALKSLSAALNAGDNSKIPGSITTDIKQTNRIQDGIVDEGAYEGVGELVHKLYVNIHITTSGDGTSWGTAIRELRDALPLLSLYPEIDSVFVAEGTYFPTATTNRNASFIIPRGNVKIYGGYAATGIPFRDPFSNATKLDGNIGNAGLSTDNSFSVLKIQGLDASSDSVVIDGFYIRNGYSNGEGANIEMTNVANGNKTAVRGCYILNGHAGSGGGINANGSPIIDNCRFIGNSASSYGGAINIFSDGNEAKITNCTFISNTSNLNLGAGIAVFGAGAANVSGSAFSSSQGSAVYAELATASLSNCSFDGNSTSGSGSAVYLNSTTGTVSNCSFSGNTATAGGTIFHDNTNTGTPQPLRISNSKFINNTAGYGGAVRADNNTGLTMISNIFQGNASTAGGGGALNFNGAGADSLMNNLFIQNKDNTAGGFVGGAIAIANGSSYVLNNTFYKDTANNGGAIAIVGGSAQVYNNLFNKNYSGNGATTSDDISGSFSGSNNILSTTDPLFVNETDPDGADDIFGTADDGLIPQCGAATNAGDNSKIPAYITTDIKNDTRIQSTAADAGAYETNNAGVQTWYLDADNDGHYVGSPVTACTSPGAGYNTTATMAGDCDENDNTKWQSATLYIDADGDGYDNGTADICYGDIIPVGYSLTTNGTDCDDNDNTKWRFTVLFIDLDGDGYSAGATGICYGATVPAGYSLTTAGPDCDDEENTKWRTGTFYIDVDGDGYDNGTDFVCFGNDVPAGYSLTTNGPDCDDNDNTKWQSGTLYIDVDGDGYDNGTATVCYGATAPAGYSLTTNGTDCDDNDNTKWQSGTLYIDVDGDGYDNGTATVCYGAIAPAGYSFTTNGADCDDNDNTKWHTAVLFIDLDGDGYSTGAAPVCYGATIPTGYSLGTAGPDCNDNDNTKWQTGSFYIDADGDGYDNGTAFICFGATIPAGYSLTTNGTDCDDHIFGSGAAPVLGNVTGISNVCPYIGTGQTLVYTVPALGGTATYQWIVPPTVNIVSGQGTNSITITIATGFVANANKQLRVKAITACGTSPEKIFYLLAQTASTPSPITGPTNVCPLLGAGTATYIIPKVTAATSYLWAAQAGTTTITHPNGAGVNDTIINMSFAAGFTTSNITVQSVNDCGVSGTRSITVYRTSASTPGLISGPTNVCQYMLPGGFAALYTIVPVAGATSYEWTTPAGSLVVHPNGAGANDNMIFVQFPAGFAGGAVVVTATNGCGTSTPRSLSVGVLNPATPSVIDVIQTHFCGEAGGRVFTYTLSSMPANATSVQWTVPTAAGAVLVSGQGSTSITVSYPGTAVIGQVTAQAISNCNVSTVRSVQVKLPACPPPTFTRQYNQATQNTVSAKKIKENDSKEPSITVMPNPSINDFTILFTGIQNMPYEMRVTEMNGKLVERRTGLVSGKAIQTGSNYLPGTYFAQLIQGNKIKTVKLIKL